MKQNNPKEYEDLMAHYEHPYSSEKCISSSIPFVEHHMKNATDLIKKSVHNPEKYESLLQHLHDLVCVKKISHFENHIHSPNPVFIHGDLWGNNMMFVDRDGIVDDVAFLDFQATRPGSAIKDILYFMYMSVQPAVRSKNFDEIVQRYFDRRNGYLKQWSKSGINVDEEYSLDKFKAEMWQFRYYGLMNAILSLPVIVFDGKDEKCDFFTFDKNNNQSKFRDRLLDIFDEFLERGNHTAFDD